MPLVTIFTRKDPLTVRVPLGPRYSYLNVIISVRSLYFPRRQPRKSVSDPLVCTDSVRCHLLVSTAAILITDTGGRSPDS